MRQTMNALHCFLPLSLSLLLVLIFAFFSGTVDAQSTSGCGSSYGCLSYPANCAGTQCSMVLKWNVVNASTTSFTAMVKVTKASIKAAWIGVAFSTDKRMGDDQAYICAHTTSYTTDSVSTYYNNPYPTIIGDGTVGIVTSNVTASGNVLTCSFTRFNSYPTQSTYFNTDANNFYLLVVYGPIKNADEGFHVDTWASERVVDVSSTAVSYTADVFDAKRKAHGTLMVIAWLFFASLGLTGPFYKRLLKEEFFGKEAWFILHRACMTFATFLALAALIIILDLYKWTWITAGNDWSDAEFAHSVFGMLVLFLAFIQITMAIFRCDKASPYRVVFRKLHRLLGSLTWLFILLAIYTGVTQTIVNVGDVGWGLVLGWNIWFILLLTFLVGMRLLVEPAENGQVATGDDDDTESPEAMMQQLVSPKGLASNAVEPVGKTDESVRRASSSNIKPSEERKKTWADRQLAADKNTAAAIRRTSKLPILESDEEAATTTKSEKKSQEIKEEDEAANKDENAKEDEERRPSRNIGSAKVLRKPVAYSDDDEDEDLKPVPVDRMMSIAGSLLPIGTRKNQSASNDANEETDQTNEAATVDEELARLKKRAERRKSRLAEKVNEMEMRARMIGNVIEPVKASASPTAAAKPSAPPSKPSDTFKQNDNLLGYENLMKLSLTLHLIVTGAFVLALVIVIGVAD